MAGCNICGIRDRQRTICNKITIKFVYHPLYPVEIAGAQIIYVLEAK